MRHALVDCGANLGHILNRFIVEHPGRDFYAFEPNPALHVSIQQQIQDSGSRSVQVSDRAVWTRDGVVDLFLGHHESSTVLRRTFRPGDDVIIKMDIEGAEYAVLRKDARRRHHPARLRCCMSSGITTGTTG